MSQSREEIDRLLSPPKFTPAASTDRKLIEIEERNPIMGAHARAFMDYARENGVPDAYIKSGYRTAERQNYLHTHGYPTKGNDGYVKVSPHQQARAIDWSSSPANKGKLHSLLNKFASERGLHIPSDEPWHMALPADRVNVSRDSLDEILGVSPMGESEAPGDTIPPSSDTISPQGGTVAPTYGVQPYDSAPTPAVPVPDVPPSIPAVALPTAPTYQPPPKPARATDEFTAAETGDEPIKPFDKEWAGALGQIGNAGPEAQQAYIDFVRRNTKGGKVDAALADEANAQTFVKIQTFLAQNPDASPEDLTKGIADIGLEFLNDPATKGKVLPKSLHDAMLRAPYSPDEVEKLPKKIQQQRQQLVAAEQRRSAEAALQKQTATLAKNAPDKLAAHIAWHFGPQTLAAIGSLPASKQRQIALMAVHAAADDEVRKARGEQIVESPDYQAIMRKRAGISDDMLVKKPVYAERANLPAEPGFGGNPMIPVDRSASRRAAEQQRIIAEEKNRTVMPGDPSLEKRLKARGIDISVPAAPHASVLEREKAIEGMPAWKVAIRDTLQPVGEGTAAALAETLRQAARYMELEGRDPANPIAQLIQMAYPKAQGKASSYLRSVADETDRNIAESSRAPEGIVDEIGQGVLRGAGGMVVELPKLIIGGKALGALNLPLWGALSSKPEEGVTGLVKGGATGLLYHFGMGATASIGRAGQFLVWTAIPTAQGIASGQKPGTALGQALPMGAFAALGGPVRVREGEAVREAKIGDLKDIQSGKLEVESPEHSQVIRPLEEFAQRPNTERVTGLEKLRDSAGFERMSPETQASIISEIEKLKTEGSDAVQERSAEAVSVGESPGDRGEVGARIPEPREIAHPRDVGDAERRAQETQVVKEAQAETLPSGEAVARAEIDRLLDDEFTKRFEERLSKPVKAGKGETTSLEPTPGERAQIEKEVEAEGAPTQKPTTYFKGDLAEYTGKEEMVAGGKFYIVKMLEGRFKGQEKAVATPPKEVETTTAPKTLTHAEIKKATAAGEPVVTTVKPYKPRSRAVDTQTMSLSQAVRAAGGIKMDRDAGNKGNLSRLTNTETGTTGLVNNRSGTKVEQLAMEMAVEGYRGDWVTVSKAEGTGGLSFDVDPNKFLEAVENDHRGVFKSWSTEKDVDFDAEYRKEFPDEMASYDNLISLMEHPEAGKTYDKVINGEANESDITAFREVAKEYGVSEQDVSHIIAEGEQARSAPEPSRQGPSESPAQQLGFVSEGLEQETAPPPRQPDQRAKLIEEEQARQRAKNPEKAAALETLARLREKGMTVDDYARQGSLIGETPSPDKLKLLRELEGGKGAPLESADGGERAYLRDVMRQYDEGSDNYRIATADDIANEIEPTLRDSNEPWAAKLLTTIEDLRAQRIEDKTRYGDRMGAADEIGERLIDQVSRIANEEAASSRPEKVVPSTSEPTRDALGRAPAPQIEKPHTRQGHADAFLRAEKTIGPDDPRWEQGQKISGIPDTRSRAVWQKNLKEILPEDVESVYHETSLDNARKLIPRLERWNARSHSIDVSDNLDLALGQGGRGVVLEFDPRLVNGFERTGEKPMLGIVKEMGGGTEYRVDSSYVGSVKAVIAKTQRQVDALKKIQGLDKRFDFDAAEQTERGIRIPRFAAKAKTGATATPAVEEAPAAVAKKTIKGYRLGDFMEFFGDDAVVAAKLLEITKTQRHGEAMAGVPLHAFERYKQVLEKQGYTIEEGTANEAQAKFKGNAENSPMGERLSFGPGAAAKGDVPAASTIEQLSEAIAKLPKGKGMRNLTASALDAADKASQGKDWVVNSLARMKAIGEAVLTRPEVTEYKKDLGDFLYAAQRSDHETRQFAKQIKKQIPSKLRREAITNYIQAGGDLTVLAQRAAASKLRLRMGYEEAQRLTDEEKTVANNISSYYESRWQEAHAAGILNGVVENYVNQAWSRSNEVTKNLMADVQRGLLEPNFRFAKQRIFDSFFEGEQIGRKPLSKDIGTLLSIYNQSLDRAIFSRQFILSLHGSKASDGRPLVEISGSGAAVPEGEEPPEQYVIRPHTKQPSMPTAVARKAMQEEPLDLSDYRVVDHPALRGWKWLMNTKGENKTPIFMKGDMLVHPEAYGHLKNVLGRSWFSGKDTLPTIARGVKTAQTTIKGTMFSLSGFHQVQEGIHALGHKVNPLNRIKLNFDDPTQSLLIKRGLQVATFDGMEEFSEGLTGGNLTNKIPILGSRIFQPYQDYLFRDFIPELKMTMALHAYERNTKRYGKTLNPDQIAEMTAEQSNAAFGELNYKYMGRNPSYQDALRVFLLAPDFLEARARFVAQAIKPEILATPEGKQVKYHGREQLAALGLLAITQYTSARILNKLLDDDYHWEPENMFRIMYKKRWFGVRTVPADIVHLISDPRGFSYHRLSPVSVAGITALTGRDDRGQKVDAAEQIKSFVKSPMPISLKGHTDDAWWESFVNSMGLQEGKYHTATEEVIRDYYNEKFPNGFPKAADPERQQLKKEIVKRQRAGDDQDDEIERLIEEGKLAKDDLKELHKKGKFSALQSSFIPLPLETAVEAVEQAKPEQKEELIPMLKKKVRRGLKKLPAEKRDALKERIDKIIE
jgi:hypothetical protein